MFLEQLGEEGASNATLNVVVANGQVCHVSDKICPFRFLDTCPLLYHAFEYGNETRLHASIAAPSRSAVVSLLRYCYTGNYLSSEAEYEPVTLLQHVEVYKMAADLDVPELQLLAHANFSCQIEFCCCLPTPPQDLRETIEFVYQNYADRASRQQSDIVATLLNYCISNFLYHKLGDNLEFLNLVSTTPAFHQDLCRTNMERNFEDDCKYSQTRRNAVLANQTQVPLTLSDSLSILSISIPVLVPPISPPETFRKKCCSTHPLNQAKQCYHPPSIQA